MKQRLKDTKSKPFSKGKSTPLFLPERLKAEMQVKIAIENRDNGKTLTQNEWIVNVLTEAVK